MDGPPAQRWRLVVTTLDVRLKVRPQTRVGASAQLEVAQVAVELSRPMVERLQPVFQTAARKAGLPMAVSEGC
jgi:hypothetical protein